MANVSAKGQKYARILSELELFNNPNTGQRLDLITKKLKMKKQNLNYYLQRFVKMGLLVHSQEQPFAIYNVTQKGLVVKEKLVQSEKGSETVTWRYHNLVVGYKIVTWGNFRFLKTKTVRMNNWNYQIVKSENGLQAHVQDTALLKIYGPKLYGEDGETLRIKASTMVAEAARWFIDHYDMSLEAPKVLRKGEKELLGSEQLAKLVGRIKTDEFFVNASAGKENLEEPDDSFAVEKILSSLQDTPGRLTLIEKSLERLTPTLDEVAVSNKRLAKNMDLHVDVLGNINDGIRELRTEVKRLRETIK